VKAKELAEQYRKDLQEHGEQVALKNLLIYLCENIIAISAARGNSAGAFDGAWKEADQKWRSIANNYPEFCLNPNGFETWTESKDMKPKSMELVRRPAHT
jgi:hypothetical protein